MEILNLILNIAVMVLIFQWGISLRIICYFTWIRREKI